MSNDETLERRTIGPIYRVLLDQNSEFTRAYLSGVKEDLERVKLEEVAARYRLDGTRVIR